MSGKDLHFNSTILILPGLGNSGEGHWQTLWEKEFGFIRVEQHEWDTPVSEDWISTLHQSILSFNPEEVILVGHSLACATIVLWASRYNLKIKGALLVAPSDVDAPSYPEGTKGFKPMPVVKLPFPTITVTSNNDFYVTISRAKQFAEGWGSELVNVGDAGHINVASGFGKWSDGLAILKRLDSL